ncbi:DNA polymerase III subunit alpha [Candidatus Magnetominusculus xianensis]|uniref:DNA polymerase III subunit alpha n=1 Tax=Candidatus Magnetominusculus xianensis TaxID=1748249 RepID=A0ABR5SIZ6_9BACT|nr:DNA polymerase III subunit alpha [Candidatus Magnetominusculus xianensis]KWT92949.1 DNA polymerase III subunit alpha [Candidatus Magnetominusculus xianensis]MBF0402953.1 DNA polymerase III subunit alpha [Nitrospirota bacterium]
MNHSDYVSLHLHTEYSLLDGAVRIDELVEKSVEYKMPAVAVTDHGNLFGAIEFYKKAIDAGVKPIIGCEVYVAQGSRFDRGKDNGKGSYFHLILLAKDMDGYKNLVSLVSRAYLEGFYYRPRIDMDLLEQYSGGLIGLTACLKGEVPYYLQRDMIDNAREAALRYKHILGPGNIYLEIQDNGIPEQIDVNRKLIELSKELNIKLVATNDTHYLKKEDSVAHDILLCIQTGKTVYDTDRMRFKTDGLYFKSPNEMKAAFSEIPEAVLNTREVADKCNLTFKLYKNMLPQYAIENGLTPDDYMERLARTGIKKKLGSTIAPDYAERFETELKIIKKMGFSSYFLIVWDFINYARTKDIPVGPGRGSAAGSLIAYSLDITDIDPLKYNLLFERFLNPERISMPDIDVDFCKDKRGEVINYTAEKFGKDHVAQIITFGTMAAKAAIRDVGRALAMPYSEVDKIAKLIPATLNITIKEGLEAEPELRNAYAKSEDVRRLLDIAMRLEGLCRHASTHAAGVVISPTPLTDYTPLYKHPSEDAVITQFDMNSIEKIGLLKFDFLGLKTLTVIQKTLEYFKERNIDFDLKHISFDDKKTYDLLSSGLTTGVFQLESPGMRDILIKMSPNRFEDLIALVALYRPGPIGSGMIDDFIKRKKGLTPVQYDLPQLKEILDETYGVILYQEQVMRIANKLAGFSMGQADILRKAMGKKISHEMDKQKDAFVDGAVKKNIREKMAVKIFDLMALFAKYGFNKSHSAAYAYISYQTAYLKAHFPVEFMAANLSCEDGSDKVVKFIKECHEMSIEILPPDINRSHSKFTIIGSAISFGLEAVKGVGSAAIESILEVRQGKPFASLEDFIQRVDSRKVNKKVIESLIKAGSFDVLIKSRAMAFDSLDMLLTGMRSMPSLFGDPLDVKHTGQVYEWEESEKLGYEKQALGFYISSHPLRRYEAQLKRINIAKTSALDDMPTNEDVRLAGIITSIKKKQLKDKKGQMAILNIEDDDGSVEAIVFPDVFQRTEPLLKKDTIVIISGRHDSSEKGHKIIVSAVAQLQRALDEQYSKIEITLDSTHCSHDTLVKIKGALHTAKGDLPVYLRLNDSEKETVIVTSYCASNDIVLIDEIESLTRKGAVALN